MADTLVQQAEEMIKNGVRSLDAERLRGEVRVINWGTVQEAIAQSVGAARKDVARLAADARAEGERLASAKGEREQMEKALAQLRAEVERLKTDNESVRAALKAATGGENLAEKCAMLDKAVAEAKKRIFELELALDYVDITEDFDLAAFQAAVRETSAKVARIEPAFTRKTKAKLPYAATVASMNARAERIRREMDELRGVIRQGQAGIAVAAKVIKLSKEGDGLFKTLKVVDQGLDLLTSAMV